ncbi:hypothetical protein ACFV8T_14220 [Streptomyces sp. NPDC059832]
MIGEYFEAEQPLLALRPEDPFETGRLVTLPIRPCGGMFTSVRGGRCGTS